MSQLRRAIGAILVVLAVFGGLIGSDVIRGRTETASALSNCNVAPAEIAYDAEETALLLLINTFRANPAAYWQPGFGAVPPAVGPLFSNGNLDRAAAWFSRDMADLNYFPMNHTDHHGRAPAARITDCDYTGWTTVGENIAAGNASAIATFGQWLNSTGHRNNMMNGNFAEIGIGRAFNAGSTYSWYWTNTFGRTPSSPSPGTLRFVNTSPSGAENGGVINVQVERVNGTMGAASVTCSNNGGTATAGQDYTAVNVILAWLPGEGGQKTCPLTPTNDALVEGNETVTLQLSLGIGAPIGSPSTRSVTITDDEAPPPPGQLTFTAATFSIGENGGSLNLTVQRTGGSGGTASASCATGTPATATAGSDFTAVATALNWAAGNASDKTCTIQITNESTFEGDETFTVRLNSITGASAGTFVLATVTITNDDPEPTGVVRFTQSSVNVSEGAGQVVLTIERSGGSAGAASATCSTTAGTATAASDYTTTSTPLSWATGNSANKTCTVPILNNATVEGNESFTVQLTGITGAGAGSPTTVTVNITDDDIALVPDIDSISPSFIVPGSSGLLTLTGTNFQPGMVLVINGVEYPVTVQNGTTGTVQLPPGLFASPGTLSIVAKNPGASPAPAIQIQVRYSKSDLDCDGDVDGTDASTVLKLIAGMQVQPAPCQPVDPNGDAVLTLADAIHVRKVAAGLLPA